MGDWILEVTSTAIERMERQAALVGLANTDEATFRSYFMAAFRERFPAGRCETEWRRYDLLVQLNGQNALIEFKYYVIRRTHDLDGRPGHTKGGAGIQNRNEFWQCVDKLRSSAHAPVHFRYLVLVYAKQPLPYHARTFHGNYGELAPDDQRVAAVKTIERDPLIGKVIQVR